MKRILLSGVTVFVAWMVIDTLAHRLLLQTLYESSPGIWRPLAELDSVLIITVTVLLIMVFISAYKVLVRPKTLISGLTLGTLLGFALGTSAGFGTYIHSPIPLALAWDWFWLGTFKGLIAGGILGLMIPGKSNG
jgi:hypothetical protein